MSPQAFLTYADPDIDGEPIEYSYVIHAFTDTDGYDWNTGVESGTLTGLDGPHAAARQVLRRWYNSGTGVAQAVAKPPAEPPYAEVWGGDMHAKATDPATPGPAELAFQRITASLQRLAVAQDRLRDQAHEAMRAMAQYEAMSRNTVAAKAAELMSRPKALEILRAKPEID